MIRYHLMAAAVSGLVLAAQPGPAAAQSAPAATQPKSSMTGGPMMGGQQSAKKPMMRSTKKGHRMNDVADRLNACQRHEPAHRQSCMEQAARP
jgi:hypothetical protein